MVNQIQQSVHSATSDREWDMRFNIPSPGDENILVEAFQTYVQTHQVDYLLIGGVERGDMDNASAWLQGRHLHVALKLKNRNTKSSLMKAFKQFLSYGYYMAPRNRNYTYKGWRDHHIKPLTKEDPEQCILLEIGNIPVDVADNKLFTKRSEEEKRHTTDQILIKLRDMLQDGKDKEAFELYPRNYMQYGEKLKMMIFQKRDFFKTNGDPHIFLHGPPGCGKSAILQIVYPKYYNKSLENRFFDLFDTTYHTHVLLQDIDHAFVEKFGVQFLKTLCDEAGFPIDQKWKTPQIIRTTVLVTSNHTLNQIIPEDLKGRSEACAALNRRFWQLHISELLRILDLKMITRYEIGILKNQGNQDPKRLFMTWDYATDSPLATPLKTAEEYQEILKKAFYK
jgi:predicted AAA+ superfamily ATPase